MATAVKIFVIFYIFIGAVVMRLCKIETALPFDQWKIFTVTKKTEDTYFIYALDTKTGEECLLSRCEALAPKHKTYYFYTWSQRMGKAYQDFDDRTLNEYKRIFSGLINNKSIRLSLYVTKLDLVAFANTKKIESLKKVLEF
jgi:hypothetical protein